MARRWGRGLVRWLELLLQRDGSGPGRGHSSQVAGVIHCCLLKVSIVCQFLFRLQLQILALSACSYLPILQLQILALSATFYLYFSFSFHFSSIVCQFIFRLQLQISSIVCYFLCSVFSDLWGRSHVRYELFCWKFGFLWKWQE